MGVESPLRIDFVSDVTCPWCAIGLYAVEQAIARLGDAVAVELNRFAAGGSSAWPRCRRWSSTIAG
jgi:predicted DsbA family dithiol-disulfide isomerase